MKKTFKRAGVAVLSMAMLLSMGAVTALTSNATYTVVTSTESQNVIATNQIKVENINTKGTTTVDSDAKVSVYRIAKRDDTTGHWSWLITAPTIGKDTVVLDATPGVNEVALTALDATQMQTLANTLKTTDFSSLSADNKIEDQSMETNITLPTGTAAVDASEVGYYLIVTTPGASNTLVVQPTLAAFDTSTVGVREIKSKYSSITVDKTITAVTNGDAGDGTHSIGTFGSEVSYSIATKTPEYANTVTSVNNFVITDDPSNGISIDVNTSNITVTVDGTKVYGKDDSDADISTDGVTVAQTAGKDGFVVTFNSAYVLANQNKDVVVTFKGTVGNSTTAVAADADAVDSKSQIAAADLVQTKGNTNNVQLTYDNNYSTGGGSETVFDGVTTYVGSIGLNKFQEDGTTALAGATFTLASSDVTDFATRNITSTAGTFDFGYLEPGTYTLTETAAPKGYKTVSAYTFTVTADKNSDGAYDTYQYAESAAVTNVTLTQTTTGIATVDITDPLADKLPGTGGIGTTLFTVGGAAVVLVAGFMFVMYMKKRGTEEE